MRQPQLILLLFVFCITTVTGRDIHFHQLGSIHELFIVKSPFWTASPAILLYIITISVIVILISRFLKSRALFRASLENKKAEMKRLEEMNKNKMDFFINISNEFRTPLTLILSQLDRLAHEMPATGRKKIDKIKNQALRLQDLINELYDFRKMEENKLSLHVQNVDLNQFLKKIYATYIDYANDKQIVYRYIHPEEELPAWIDPKQFQKVIYNLLTFVFKFTSRKDSVIVSLQKRSKCFEITINYTGQLPDDDTCNYLFSLINDYGKQMPDLSLLPEGGLGVIFSKGIVNLHEGELFTQTTENGVIFHLQLKPGNSHFSSFDFNRSLRDTETLSVVIPDLPEEESAEPERIVKIKEEANKPEMLLIEDNDEVRSLLKEIFSFNYKIVEMPDTGSAYEYTSKNIPDIILCEIMVPGTNGIELCAMLKNNIRTMNIPIILLTSQPSEKQQIESIRSGSDDYIIKPFNVDMLVLRCNYLVKNRKKMQENKINNPDEILQEAATNTREKEFLLMAQHIVEKNMSNPDFDTTVWSKQLGIGRTRLFSQIKNITGMTPNDYILQMKLNKSLVLLGEHALTIGEIAYRLGFSSPAYFSKCFKKQYGMTPAEYRKKI